MASSEITWPLSRPIWNSYAGNGIFWRLGVCGWVVVVGWGALTALSRILYFDPAKEIVGERAGR